MKKLLYLTLVFLIGFQVLNAQTVEAPIRQKVPILNGHMFLSTSYLRSSFITTHLHADLGFGSTSPVSIPGIIIDDIEILDFEGKLIFVDMNVQYQQRFTPWLALYMSVKMAGRVGTDMSTIVADGVNTITGGDIGWLIRIKETEKFNLSASVSINNLTGSFINVSEYIRDLINDVPNPAVIKKVPSLIASVGLRGAYAFNPTFGLQMQLDYGYGESFERGTSKSFFSGGVLGDVNFRTKYNVPIGLALGYTRSSAPIILMNNGGASNLIIGKVGYTGSNDFELGLQYTYYNVPLQSVESDPSISKILLTLKFYF